MSNEVEIKKEQLKDRYKLYPAKDLIFEEDINKIDKKDLVSEDLDKLDPFPAHAELLSRYPNCDYTIIRAKFPDKHFEDSIHFKTIDAEGNETIKKSASYYKGKFMKVYVAKCNGSLKIGDQDFIARPCPPYCGTGFD